MPMEPKSFYHNRTLLIQGGSALLDQYYHLTLAQHSAVIALLTPPGTDKQVIFNNALAWGAASAFYWDEGIDCVGIGIAPTAERLTLNGWLELYQSSTADEKARLGAFNATFNGVVDTIINLGTNVKNGARVDATKPAIHIGMEADWYDGATHWTEWYLQTYGNVNPNYYRPFYQLWNETDLTLSCSTDILIAPLATSFFKIREPVNNVSLLSLIGSGQLGIGFTTDTAQQQLALQSGSIMMRQMSPVVAAPTVALAGLGAGLIPVGNYKYLLTWYNNAGETEGGTISAQVSPSAGDGQVNITYPINPDRTCVGIKIYRSTIGSVDPYKLVTTIANNLGGTFTDNVAAPTSLYSSRPTSGAGVWLGTDNCVQFIPGGYAYFRGYRPDGAALGVKNGTVAAQAITTTTSDWVAGTTGTALFIGFGATTGNTYCALTGAIAGGGNYANIAICGAGGNVGIGTLAPTALLSLGGNVARKIWMERHTTADTAGNTLTLQAGGCTAAATSKAGGSLFLAPGASTGTAKADLRIQRLTRGAAATTDNTLKDAIIVPSEFNLTDEAANSIFEVALPTLTTFCGRMIFGVNVSNGTDTQAYQGNLDITAENKGGVYTSTIPESTSTFSATSASTLTLAWSIVTGADKITITLTPTSSLVPTSMKLIYTLINNSNQAVTQL